MRRTTAGLAVLSLVLAGGCQDETQQSEIEAQAQAEAAGGSAELYFAYPGDGQNSVPVSTPVFMRFGGEIDTPIAEMEPEQVSDFLRLEKVGGDGETVAIRNVQLVGDGRGIQAEPAESLTPGREYELIVSGLSVSGELVNETLAFSTGASDRGPLVERMDMSASAEGFEVARITPYANGDTKAVGQGTDEFPVSDLSTFRVQFTEPVNENTISYGMDQSVQLVDGDGNLVEAEMLVRDHHMTVDPDSTLTPGETYELSLGTQITSRIDGSGLPEDSSWRFTPMDSTSPGGARSVQAQQAVTNAGKLALTGKEANSVLLSATSLGQNNKTIQEGTVFAQLGFVPRFDQAGKSVPLRIERGALLTGSNVEVLVGGEVPAGYGSGEIDVRFISDANGYLMPNPYTDSPDAPRIVRLFLDLAMNTGDKRGNGALAQELLHVELIGTAMVDDGILNLEAVSVIEPGVLGLEKASGLISFKLQTFEDATTAPSPEDFADTSAPSLKSWSPSSEHADKVQPQDSIALFFSEPLLPSTVNQETVWVTDTTAANSPRIEANIRQNGANIIVDPVKPLQYGTEYEVAYDSAALTDLAGNNLSDGGVAGTFKLRDTDSNNTASSGTNYEGVAPAEQSPLVLTTRPGYPCAKTTVNVAPDSEYQGQCAGGQEDDDRLPIIDHPKDEPIHVRFSQNMNPGTLVSANAGSSEPTVVVEKFNEAQNGWIELPFDAADTQGESVGESFKLEKGSRFLRIIPLESWEKGALYRYTLKSRQSADGSGAAIESVAGNPIQTQLLTTGVRGLGEKDSGGPDLVNYFTGGEPSDDAYTPLSNLPTVDANSDLSTDGENTSNGQVVPNSGKLSVGTPSTEPINDDTVVEGANVGCQVGSNCPEKTLFYLTALLDVDVVGEANENGHIPVEISPSTLSTTNINVWVKIDTAVTDALAALGIADTGIEENEEIPTGPMVMRIRYEDEDGNGDGQQPVPGVIKPGTDSALEFETTLDVYLDSPYLNPSIGPAQLDHQLRSYEINDLTLSGPIQFYDDGRMEISLKNEDPIDIAVEATGEIDISSDNTDGLCAIPIVDEICTGAANGILDADTRINLTIPPDNLSLNYITPNTQKQE